MKCKPGYGLIVESKTCVKECPENTTNNNGVCTRCIDKDCNKCVPNKIDTCIVCKKGKVLLNGQCINECPDGTYEKNSACHKCKEKCKSCFNEKECSSCKNPLGLYNGDCTDSCPVGTVLYKEKCQKCTDSNCNKCKSSLTECLECKKPFSLFRNNCVKDCPEHYYSKNGECRRCKRGCDKCLDENKCTYCENGFYLDGNECKTSCPKKKYPNCTKRICENCNEACDECVDNTNKCHVCSNGFFKSLNRCVPGEKCPPGTYSCKKTGKCLKCQVEFCNKCSTKNTCSGCLAGFKLVDGKCREAKHPILLFRGPKHFSPETFTTGKERETISFNQQSLAGVVGSPVLGMSFWFRYLKSSLEEDFETAVWETVNDKSPPIANLSFYVKGFKDTSKPTKCGLRMKTPDNKQYDLLKISCEYADMINWSFFYVLVNVNQKAKIASIVLSQYNSKTGKFNSFNTEGQLHADLLTKDSICLILLRMKKLTKKNK
jgi:hypothetical protein